MKHHRFGDRAHIFFLLACGCALPWAGCGNEGDPAGHDDDHHPAAQGDAGGAEQDGGSAPGSGGAQGDATTPAANDVDGSTTPRDGAAADARVSPMDARAPSAGDARADGAPGNPPMSIPSDGGLPARTEGCGKAAQATASQGAARKVMVTGAAAARDYILDIPSSYDPNKAYPLLFGFHGATSSATAFRNRGYGNLPAAAGAEAILVHPMALAGSSGTVAWNDPSDVAFFDAILSELRAELCIDGARIFATGHSSGGFMTNTLGCVRGDVLRGIAPLAAGGPFGRGCMGQVAAWIEHGDADATVALSSGETSRNFWARASQCDTAAPMPVSPSPCVTYAGCDPANPVHWCVQPGQTHSPMPTFSAAGAWAFFKSLQ